MVGAMCPSWTHTTVLLQLTQAETPLLPPGVLPVRTHLPILQYARGIPHTSAPPEDLCPGTAVPVVQGMSLSIMETQLLSCANTTALTCQFLSAKVGKTCK